MKKEKVALILIMMIFFITFGILYFVINDNRKLTIVEVLIKEPILFIQKIAIKPINIIEDIKESNKLKEKLKKQKTEIEKYKIVNNELEDKNKKIEELEGLLNISNTSTDYEVLSANIINRNVGYWYQEFTIDKGNNDGIKNNDAVVTSKGLIGKIIKTTPNYSVVKLLTSVNDKFRVAVLIETNEDKVFGILSDYRNGFLIVTGISYNKEIQEGSIVTTSGLDNIFPPGIAIGKVLNIEKDNYDLEQIVSVESSVQFDYINYVSILKRKK